MRALACLYFGEMIEDEISCLQLFHVSLYTGQAVRFNGVCKEKIDNDTSKSCCGLSVIINSMVLIGQPYSIAFLSYTAVYAHNSTST